MGTFVMIVSLIFIFGAWYYWKKKPNKKAMIVCIVLALIFGGLYSMTDDYKQEQAQEAAESRKNESSKKAESSEKAASESKQESKKKAERASAAAEKESAKKVVKEVKNNGIANDDQVKLLIKKYAPDVKVKDISGEYGNPREMYVDLKGQDNFTAKLTLRGFWDDTVDIWKAFKKSGDAESFNKIVITVDTKLEDTAGNESTEHALRTSLSGEKIQKLNLKNFKNSNVPNYADYYWQSTAFPDIAE
ncbi:signal peptidase II [Loigolactobacillus rennini]|nr:signal peptidase II [Loigolactobacillus rennini]